MREEINLEEIKNKVNKDFGLRFYIKGDKLVSDNLNIRIIGNDEFCKMEEKAIKICDRITEEFGCFVDYSLLDEGYEIVIHIF